MSKSGFHLSVVKPKPVNQSELEANSCSRRLSRRQPGKTHTGKSQLVLVLLLIRRETSDASFFSQSQTVAMKTKAIAKLGSIILEFKQTKIICDR